MEIEKCLSNLSTPLPTTLMLGDFNLPGSVMSWIPLEGQLVPHVLNHRQVEDESGVQTRLQAKKLCELCTNLQMTQIIGEPTHQKEILDLVFTTDNEAVLNVDMEYFPVFSDHKVLRINLAARAGESESKPEMHLLDSAQRLRKLDFSKAPWADIRRKLKEKGGT